MIIQKYIDDYLNEAKSEAQDALEKMQGFMADIDDDMHDWTQDEIDATRRDIKRLKVLIKHIEKSIEMSRELETY